MITWTNFNVFKEKIVCYTHHTKWILKNLLILFVIANKIMGYFCFAYRFEFLQRFSPPMQTLRQNQPFARASGAGFFYKDTTEFRGNLAVLIFCIELTCSDSIRGSL